MGARLVFSRHSSPPLPLSSRMRGPIPSPPFPTQTSFRAFSESVPRNLAAGSQTPLQPTSSRRGVPWSLFHKSSPMIYAKYVKTISDDLPGENMEYGPKVRHSCQSRNPEGPILGEVRLLKQAPCGRPSCVFPSFFASLLRVLAHAEIHPLFLNHMSSRVPRGISLPSRPLLRVLAHAGTHLLPTISHPNIIPNAAKPCRESRRHSSHPLSVSSRMRGPIPSS